MARGEPERTCVGCRGRAPKAALIRIARSKDGTVRVDPDDAAPGRGAYVHRDPACVAIAAKRGAIVRALRTGLEPDEAARLMADVERNAGR